MNPASEKRVWSFGDLYDQNKDLDMNLKRYHLNQETRGTMLLRFV